MRNRSTTQLKTRGMPRHPNSCRAIKPMTALYTLLEAMIRILALKTAIAVAFLLLSCIKRRKKREASKYRRSTKC